MTDEAEMARKTSGLLLAAVFLLAGIQMANAGTYDGTWSVVQVCDTTKEGARGYTWRYDAEVKDGHFVGQYRNKGQSPSLTLQGQIQPDGSASLQATGISADSDHNINFAQPQAPIYFRVAAKFEGSKGSGTRLGVRACTFTFGRH